MYIYTVSFLVSFPTPVARDPREELFR